MCRTERGRTEVFDPTPQYIEQLNRFGNETGAIIVTVHMSAHEREVLAELLERWSSGESAVRQVILDRFAVEPEDDMVI